MALRAFKLERVDGGADPEGSVVQAFRDAVERTLAGVRGTIFVADDSLAGPFTRLRIDDERGGSLCLMHDRSGRAISDRMTRPVFDAILERHKLQIVLIDTTARETPVNAAVG